MDSLKWGLSSREKAFFETRFFLSYFKVLIVFWILFFLLVSLSGEGKGRGSDACITDWTSLQPDFFHD
jgi:amino acid permease